MSPISRFALALLVATTVSSAVLPSNGLILSPDSILRNLDPYTAPTQKLTTILAIGDSYTAGEGANGVRDYIKSSGNCNRYKASWPLKLAADPAWNDFNGGQPDLVFGACAGAKMGGLVERQLEQGKPDGGREYTRIGKPEIGVMMIGGNDAGFFEYIPSSPLPN
jgi:lysophospholipase L1-like esterase